MLLLFTCKCVFHYSDQCDSKQPIYEHPPKRYTAERILQILLDPSIPKEKICKLKPSNITSSATFVVDVCHLKCVDDIKKDDFGIWNYSGSHPQAYEVFVQKDGYLNIEKCSDDSSGDNVVYLRRLHCTHPSNQDFKCMICFISGN